LDVEAPESYDYTPVLLGEKYTKPIRNEYIHLYYAIRRRDWELIFDLEDI